MFKIGQKLVCIQDEPQSIDHLPNVVKGEIYTYLCEAFTKGYICLREMGDHVCYDATAFRPVQDIGDQVEEHIKSLQPVETLETV